MSILVADGLKEIDKEALEFCLSVEGDVYYHVLAEDKGLMRELLVLNDKCSVIEVDDDGVEAYLNSGEAYEAHVFYKKRGRQVALAVAVGMTILVCGIALGRALWKR